MQKVFFVCTQDGTVLHTIVSSKTFDEIHGITVGKNLGEFLAEIPLDELRNDICNGDSSETKEMRKLLSKLYKIIIGGDNDDFTEEEIEKWKTLMEG